MVEAVERTYGDIDPTIIAEKRTDYTGSSGQNKLKIIQECRDKMVATIFMNGAHAGFKPLLNDLKSEYALGADKYPKTIEDAYKF